MSTLSLASQTLFAELQQRSLDAEFDGLYNERGRFVRVRSAGRQYWHFRETVDGGKVQTYVGPVADKSIGDRIARFGTIKADFKERQEMVRALKAAGLPTPDAISSDVITALWKAGFFRLRGVLVGTLAFQTYAGPLGMKMAGRPLQTQDVDFAQFWGISENFSETMPPMLDVLRGVDATFAPVPHLDDPFVATAYRNASFYRVDFLTPNRGAQEHQGKAARMKSLGGASAQPLRHLDFLIHDPERSVLLTNGGVPVTVPRAERYAVHKLIVAAERKDQAKAGKDVMQAETLIAALATKRPIELADAWATAWDTGDRWRDKLERGRERLSASAKEALDRVAAQRQSSRKRRRKS